MLAPVMTIIRQVFWVVCTLAHARPRGIPHGGFPDGVRVDNSYVTLPDLPGIGFEGKADLYAEMEAQAE